MRFHVWFQLTIPEYPTGSIFFWTLSVSLRIFLYLFVSLCIFLYLYVSLRIFMYLYVSFCF